MTTRRELLGALAALPVAGLLGSKEAYAQNVWPSRPITIVILGVPVVIDNKSGGRGAIAMQSVARTKADCYDFRRDDRVDGGHHAGRH